MSNITLPRRDFPIAGTLAPSNDWFRWARDVTERVGGVTGPGTTDLALSQFEDAGIEEMKALLFEARDSLAQFPQQQPASTAEEASGEVSALREEVAALRARLTALEQGLYA